MSKSNDQLLHCIKRGVTGYLSYLSACQMTGAFSEHTLYEPMLRILNALGAEAMCEVKCKGMKGPESLGPNKRIDFVFRRKQERFAIEVKWVKIRHVDVKKDCEKLIWFKQRDGGSAAYIMFFGRMKTLKSLKIKSDDRLREKGVPFYADFGKTKYGCRVYEVMNGNGQ